MADISKYTDPNGITYDLKDAAAMTYPYLRTLATKTYTDVIASANNHQGAAFFYLKVRGTTYDTMWHVKVRVRATVLGQVAYNTDSVFEIAGNRNVSSGWTVLNRIFSTSYRPIYYNSLFRVSSTGYNNGCGTWIGFNLYSSTNLTDASYKRTVTVDLLEYEDCTVELQDSLITPTNIPNRAEHTNWYSSTESSFDNFNASTNGFTSSGDQNTTTISNLYRANGTYITAKVLYRYQLLFHTDDDHLTPLNIANDDVGTSKEMLTDIEFDVFKPIYYYSTTTTVNEAASLGAGYLYYSAGNADLRYSFNCGQTLTAQKSVYLVVQPQSNGLCKIVGDLPITQTLPSTQSDYWYVFLGRTYSSYQMSLYNEHPVYMHDGESLKRVFPHMIPQIMRGATSENDGYAGAVPTPSAEDYDKCLYGDGTWKTVPRQVYDPATSTKNGLMSATDKSKLDQITTVPIASGVNITEGTDGLIVTFN